MAETIRPPKVLAHLERLRRWQRGESPPPPIAELIGIRPVEFEVGQSKFAFTASRRHANPMGTLHGGIICDLADVAMGTAMATTLEEDESFTTLDLTAKYFKPIRDEQLTATGRVTKRTRTLGLIECEVTDSSGSLVAKVFSTCMVLRGERAEGRRPGDVHRS
jgi:uncharacterized protein (TIGR00369 family)